MLFGRVGQTLGLQLGQGTDDTETRVARFDYIVDITVFSSLVRVREELVVFGFFFGQESFRVLGFLRAFGMQLMTMCEPP